jgi:kynureninase
MRFGFTPLYLSHQDVVDAVEILADILNTGSWDKPEFKTRAKVT